MVVALTLNFDVSGLNFASHFTFLVNFFPFQQLSVPEKYKNTHCPLKKKKRKTAFITPIATVTHPTFQDKYKYQKFALDSALKIKQLQLVKFSIDFSDSRTLLFKLTFKVLFLNISGV